LQIENSQYNQKIDERNQELLELKKTTGRTVQVLNTTKQELNELLNQTQELTAGNADKAKIIADLQVALTQTEVCAIYQSLSEVCLNFDWLMQTMLQGELEQQQRINSKYSRQQASADMPQVCSNVFIAVYIAFQSHLFLSSDFGLCQPKIARVRLESQH
jgi:vacuolar-type H+-ATPase subunit I/STV1